MKLYVMVGIPGSGKSTFTKQHPECEVICPDTIRKEIYGDESVQENGYKIFKIAYDRTQLALENGKDVIFDATNTTKRSRSNFKNFNAERIAVYMDTDIEICKTRNAQRERKVPEEVIDNMAKKITIPSIEEGFNKVIFIRE